MEVERRMEGIREWEVEEVGKRRKVSYVLYIGRAAKTVYRELVRDRLEGLVRGVERD